MIKSPYLDIKRKIVFDNLEKYPETATRALARIIYAEGPELFKDYEDARSWIRVYRGQRGPKLREQIKMKKYYKDEI